MTGPAVQVWAAASPSLRVTTKWDDITVAIGLALGGEQEQGRPRLTACWERTDEDAYAQRCVIAHYLADLQDDIPAEVAWDEAALAAFPQVRDADLAPVGLSSARGLAPSLHLNLGDGYLRQGRVDDAAAQLAAGQGACDALGDDGYSAMIRRGLDALGDRIDAHRTRVATRLR